MKRTMVLTGLLTTMAFWGCQNKQNAYKPAEVYAGLRTQVLNLASQQPAILTHEKSKIIGVLMEIGFPEAVATLATVADGSVSMYFSNGGGMIGLGGHENVKLAGINFLREADNYLPMATKTEAYPLPKQGEVLFYFITQEGIFTLNEKTNILANKKSKLSPLFIQGNIVITHARMTEEKKEK